jgi:hypothetical protein
MIGRRKEEGGKKGKEEGRSKREREGEGEWKRERERIIGTFNVDKAEENTNLKDFPVTQNITFSCF